MKLSAQEATFFVAWMVSRSMTEFMNRMDHTMTPAEARQQARTLRARGVPLPAEPAGEGIGRRVVLTPHPTDDRKLDKRGWPAVRPRGVVHVSPQEIREGPWPCQCCGRESLSGWCLVEPHAGGPVNYEFACDQCATAVL